ncbi:MAG: hypothetical protein ACYTFQ_18940 [Planctomycetota bacterium]|jgi:hypothetical protein
MHLMIQNKGVAPVEAFTLLGASTSRDDTTKGVIGQFGTGAKHAINVLLRAGLEVRAYCGKTRLTFFTKTETVKDDFGAKEVQRVYVKYGGTSTKTEALGWVLDFGAIDWQDLGMALREFVSNALDRTIRDPEQDLAEARQLGDLTVIPVDDNARKAKDGYTRVFIEINDQVLKYYGELPKRFLHFSDHPEQATQSLLPKADRNLTDRRTAMIYRCGVFVMEMTELRGDSLYDYNFEPSQIAIDDCRNSNEYSIRASCARLLRAAKADQLAPIFKMLQKGTKCFESELDSSYLLATWEDGKDEEKDEWQDAWAATAGDSVLADDDKGPGALAVAQLAGRKGHKVAKMPTNWATVASRMGITTATQVLTDDEKKGRETIPATQAALEAVDQVWEWIELTNLTQGKSKPSVKCFRDITDAEGDCMGYFKHGGTTVYLREDIASEGVNKYLLKTALEECAHYVTGSTDLSRDFQNYFMDMIVETLHSPLEVCA